MGVTVQPFHNQSVMCTHTSPTVITHHTRLESYGSYQIYCVLKHFHFSVASCVLLLMAQVYVWTFPLATTVYRYLFFIVISGSLLVASSLLILAFLSPSITSY